MQTIVIALQNSVDFKDMGVATSSNTFFRSLGSVFGTAIFGSILTNRVGHYLQSNFAELATTNPAALKGFDMAKAETINPIAALLTPNDLAKTGIAGMTMPKPTATKKDAATRIETSRGRSLNGDRINPESLLRLHHVQLRTPC